MPLTNGTLWGSKWYLQAACNALQVCLSQGLGLLYTILSVCKYCTHYLPIIWHCLSTLISNASVSFNQYANSPVVIFRFHISAPPFHIVLHIILNVNLNLSSLSYSMCQMMFNKGHYNTKRFLRLHNMQHSFNSR